MNKSIVFIICGILAFTYLDAGQPTPTNPSGLDVGRFQVSDKYVIDTITGRVQPVEKWINDFPDGPIRVKINSYSWFESRPFRNIVDPKLPPPPIPLELKEPIAPDELNEATK